MSTGSTDFSPPPATVSGLPASDIQAPVTEDSVVHQAFPVRRPESELKDFMVQVRAGTLDRRRMQLASVTKARSPWPWVMLGVSSLAFGSFL